MGEVHADWKSTFSKLKIRVKIWFNAPTLTPARRSSPSFSTVFTFGPIGYRNQHRYLQIDDKIHTDSRDDRSLFYSSITKSFYLLQNSYLAEKFSLLGGQGRSGGAQGRVPLKLRSDSIGREHFWKMRRSIWLQVKMRLWGCYTSEAEVEGWNEIATTRRLGLLGFLLCFPSEKMIELTKRRWLLETKRNQDRWGKGREASMAI